MTRSPLALAVALLADLAAVAVFALGGLDSHGGDLARFALVAAPFAAGVLVGEVVAVLLGRPFALLRGGVPVWAAALVVGFAGRALLGDDVPLSFAVVTAVVLGVLVIGWRAVVLVVRVLHDRRQSASSASSAR